MIYSLLFCSYINMLFQLGFCPRRLRLLVLNTPLYSLGSMFLLLHLLDWSFVLAYIAGVDIHGYGSGQISLDYSLGIWEIHKQHSSPYLNLHLILSVFYPHAAHSVLRAWISNASSPPGISQLSAYAIPIL